MFSKSKHQDFEINFSICHVHQALDLKTSFMVEISNFF